MTARKTMWVLTILLIGTVVALLVPGSPINLLDLWAGEGQFFGRSTRSWTNDLESPDADARLKAIFAMGALGAKADHAVPKLAKIMTESANVDERNQAALSLSKMMPGAKAAVAALAQALEDDEAFVRMNAAMALQRLRTDAKSAAPALIKAMEQPQNDTNLVRFTVTIQGVCALALVRATKDSGAAVQPLADALKSAKTLTSKLAYMYALTELGPAARPALDLVRTFAKDNELQVRAAAKEAVEAIEAAP